MIADDGQRYVLQVRDRNSNAVKVLAYLSDGGFAERIRADLTEIWDWRADVEVVDREPPEVSGESE